LGWISSRKWIERSFSCRIERRRPQLVQPLKNLRYSLPLPPAAPPPRIPPFSPSLSPSLPPSLFLLLPFLGVTAAGLFWTNAALFYVPSRAMFIFCYAESNHSIAYCLTRAPSPGSSWSLPINITDPSVRIISYL